MITIVPFDPAIHCSDWDKLVISSFKGTFLHTRKFLSYHGSRFIDRSLLYFYKNKLIAILAAASQKNDSDIVISHPGISYGGFLLDKTIHPDLYDNIIKATIDYYKSIDVKKIIYKYVPAIYSHHPAEDDKYYLFLNNFTLSRVDISSVINLNYKLPLSSRRKRSLKKSSMYNLSLSSSWNHISGFWSILSQNLQGRHMTTPTHTFDEINLLHEYFDDKILLMSAFDDKELVAGVLFFNNLPVFHAQYIASSANGNNISALDFLFNESIKYAESSGYKYFDFGISTTNNGKVINSGLYSFKSEFGATGISHEFFELNL